MSSEDLDLYEGRMKIVRLDENRLGELDSILEDFLEGAGGIPAGSKMVVNIKDDVVTVRVLEKRG